ncbi:MAG: hypothetical protein KKD63_06990, partial [Proteobacteria bacterium]|nr:hypothetical protein [Pseudomonadota bacterium]
PIDEVKTMLSTGAPSSSIPWMAPAQGLFFEKAFYDRGVLDSFVANVPLIPAPRTSEIVCHLSG